MATAMFEAPLTVAAALETTIAPAIELPCVNQTHMGRTDWHNHPPIHQPTPRSRQPLTPAQLQAAFAALPSPHKRIGLDAVLDIARKYKRAPSASQSSCQLLTRDKLRALLAALIESITGEHFVMLDDSMSFLELRVSLGEIALNLVNGAAALGANVNSIDHSQPLTVGTLLDAFFERNDSA